MQAAVASPETGGGNGPAHVAIIMDGNGRWATQRGRPRVAGHRVGAERVREIVRACPDLGVRYLTLYAFSTENWKRSVEEVITLMGLLERYILSETEKLSREGVRVRFIGDRARLSERLQRLMERMEARTCANDRLHLTIAVNYGARDEIARAARTLARDLAEGRLSEEEADETALGNRMDTAGLPDPDLVVRTSGETRVSNFLLWQSAYSEYLFTRTLWPDFSVEDLRDAISHFAGRERRFGAVARR
ncbi:MAG: di-trans,poly-cis-decaprenylcistransferase [Rhodobacteraceae bacterium]|nr:di-trans,poly-cis-decaprenylcistransferase [Paracoccaceae bacterium]